MRESSTEESQDEISLLKKKRAEGKSSGYILIEEVGEAQQSDLVPREPKVTKIKRGEFAKK